MKTKIIIAALVFCAAPAILSAQETRDPFEVARAIDACNGATVLDAAWQPDGRLGVKCPRGAGENAGGAGATNFAIPLLGLVALGALAGGGSTSSTSGTN